MLHCNWCNTEKSESDFYKSDIRKGGYGKCKDCVCSAVQKNRKRNIDYYQEYEKGRARLPHRVEARKEYAKTEVGRLNLNKGKIAYARRYPNRANARYLVSNAVRDGKLIKPNVCSKCNSSGKIHGHHSDYNKPLEVIWFCEGCHADWHRNNTPIYCD